MFFLRDILEIKTPQKMLLNPAIENVMIHNFIEFRLKYLCSHPKQYLHTNIHLVTPNALYISLFLVYVASSVDVAFKYFLQKSISGKEMRN